MAPHNTNSIMANLKPEMVVRTKTTMPMPKLKLEMAFFHTFLQISTSTMSANLNSKHTALYTIHHSNSTR
jgi:hypothetical protein